MDFSPAEESTRERLRRAATEIFVEKGYAGATVRDICKRAKANVAAVNYHFGSKEGLYENVLTTFKEECERRFPLDLDLPPEPTPEDRLLACIRALLLRMAGDDDPVHAAQGKLMSMEIMNPTSVLDRLMTTYMMPCSAFLTGIVRDLLGPEAEADTVRVCVGGVVSQCVFYVQNRTVITRLYPGVSYDHQGLMRIAQDILRFSLHGIMGIRLCTDLPPAQ